MESRAGFRLAGIGLTTASEVMAGALIGWLIDQWRGEGSTFLLIGAIAGIVVGLTTLIRSGLTVNRQMDEAAARKNKTNPRPPTPGNPGTPGNPAPPKS